MITESTPIRRKPNLLDAEVDGEIVALDVEAGDCYGFNSVASAVWNCLEDVTSIDAICAHLCGEFDVPEKVCRSEVVGLIKRLNDDGLIMASEPLQR